MIALGLLSTAGPTVLYFRLLKQAPAAKAALVHYLVPLAAVTYGIALLGERPRLETILGGACILLCAWIATQKPKTATA